MEFLVKSCESEMLSEPRNIYDCRTQKLKGQDPKTRLPTWIIKVN
jgi:hypothetical protein